VIGYINNNAPSTIIIGAHYYHPGHNEDGGATGRGSKQVYHGTGDNAGGAAAVIELARLLKKSKARKNNYLLVAFSGAASGWQGSEYFAAYPTVDLSVVNYMINMAMIGSMDDNEKVLNIAGAGTSPEWNEIIYARKNTPFTIKADSIGANPGDYLSFYQKNIPVLSFSAGPHSDDHKSGDNADKINYTGELYIIKYIGDLIEGLNRKGKLAFTPVKEITTAIK
jgi:Zn-dependent M28 family amino/carboxypeptidase